MAASTSLTPAQRKLRASIASNTFWSQCDDRSAHTAPARAGVQRRFEKIVDPDGALPPDELAKRVANERRKHMQRMAFKSTQARQRKDGLTN